MADIYSMSFSRVFSLLVAKAERKGKGREEVERIVENLFGYSKEDISEMERKGTTYGDFLSSPPSPNPNRFQKKGRVCSVRVEDIENPLERDMRILDLIVEELAKGKDMEKILIKERE